MKKIALFIVASSFSLAVNAQDSKTKTSATTPAAPAGTTAATATQVAVQPAANPKDLKDHLCTMACKNNNGVHVYAHGEKGHTCTDACKKTAAPAPATAPKK